MKSRFFVMLTPFIIGASFVHAPAPLAAQQPHRGPACAMPSLEPTKSSLPESPQGSVLPVSTSTVTPPTVQLSDTSLFFFGPQQHQSPPPRCTATSPNPRRVTVTNQGPGVLHFTSIAVSGAFSQTNTCGASLGAGQSCKITVTWSKFGTFTNSSLWIYDDGAASPQSVRLTGYAYRNCLFG
jgi:hypothetical protein